MKIRMNNEPKAVEFISVHGGECFLVPEEENVCMRLAWEIEECNGDRWNYVDLATGDFGRLRDYDKVILLKAEVVIIKEG